MKTIDNTITKGNEEVYIAPSIGYFVYTTVGARLRDFERGFN